MNLKYLEELEETFKQYTKETTNKYKIEAYNQCADTITNLITDLKQKELSKLLALGEKFDTDHMNYSVINERGHIESPTEYHEYLSQFSTQEIDARDVFDKMDDGHREQILIDVVKDKGMNEQLVAYRHGFDYITHTKGHDGITTDNKVYEVKNHQYKRPKKDGRFQLGIKFDRLSENNLRKLNEGRPEIILNSTDGHKLLIEMRLDFTDEMIETYKQKLAGVKGKDTSGTNISFSDYKHAIREVTYLADDFEDYNFSLDLLKYLNETQGKTYNTDRKSTLCPNVQDVLRLNTEYIKIQHENGMSMAALGRELTTDKTKISASHIKRVLVSDK
jgi:hypothetical protein